jgi:hypothetical protein
MGAGSSSVHSEAKILQSVHDHMSQEQFATMEELVLEGLDPQDRLHLIEALRDNELEGVAESWSWGEVTLP